MATIIHNVSNSFPLDPLFFGQSFVVGGHVLNSNAYTYVSNLENENISDEEKLLQSSVAKKRFRTNVFYRSKKSLRANSDYFLKRDDPRYFTEVKSALQRGPVSVVAHYFNRKGYQNLTELKKEFGKDISTFVQLHCLADLHLGDLHVTELKQRQKNIRDSLHRFIDSTNSYFVAVSEAVRESFYQHGVIPKGRIKVVRNGVSSDLYKKVSEDEKRMFREELGINAEKVVGYVGRVDAKVKGGKNLVKIISEFEKQEDVGFVIASSPHYGLRDFIKQVNEEAPRLVRQKRFRMCLDVSKFTRGFYTKDSDVCKFFINDLKNTSIWGEDFFQDVVTLPVQPYLDVYLQPSNTEAISLSIIEALMSEIPVVASRVGGIPEVVNPNSGRLIDIKEKNPDEFVPVFRDAVNHYLEHPLNSQISEESRKNLICDGFDNITMAKNLDEVFLSK